MKTSEQSDWHKAVSASELADRRQAVVKPKGRQILVLQHGNQVFACDNRCPHEGHPLAKGVLDDECRLTCNWHNWKFDLVSGETIRGGDQLRRYPVRRTNGMIEVDLTEPPAAETRQAALTGLRTAFDEHDYTRLAREAARFEQAEGDFRELLIAAFDWAAAGLEDGTTHAHAAAPDWLALRSRLPEAQPADRLVPLVEILGHASWDALQQPGTFPLASGQADAFDADALTAAIEAEDEDAAIRLARAGLAEGGGALFRPVLERAALRHYQGFGHSVIYAFKTYQLLELLGPDAAPALLLPLVRSLCVGTREDLIPEFRAYAPALAAWDGTGTDMPNVDDFRGASVARCLDLIAGGSSDVDALYNVLMHAASDAMLYYDARFREQFDGPIGHNIDWLDFSHALTQLNASRMICGRQPKLWPAALLQAGCFLGRNAAFVDWDQDVGHWAVDEPDALFDGIFVGLLDHGQPTYIFVAHTLKLASALRAEIDHQPDAPWVPTALAALNRFVHEPAKQKHVRRSAHQAWSFVSGAG